MARTNRKTNKALEERSEKRKAFAKDLTRRLLLNPTKDIEINDLDLPLFASDTDADAVLTRSNLEGRLKIDVGGRNFGVKLWLPQDDSGKPVASIPTHITVGEMERNPATRSRPEPKREVLPRRSMGARAVQKQRKT